VKQIQILGINVLVIQGINRILEKCKSIYHCQVSDDANKVSFLIYLESLNELKVFVDLASMSAGESDYEIAKVNCLHAATTGYASLIFGFDDGCDITVFLAKCNILWKELKADPKLPIKLADTYLQLDWLKSVKKVHGSVEVTSLFQAEAINSKGIYRVGFLGAPQKDELELSDVLDLRVGEDGSYTFTRLQDLQSRLMLVAGKAEKGKEDVERFTMTYDGITRLCKVYIKLLSSGCVLFKNWKATFLCDPKRPVCMFIEFGNAEEKAILKGHRGGEELCTLIPSLAKFMEDCLQSWLEYIDRKRYEYFHLNYFTIDQLVILQQELAKLGVDEEPSNWLYPLLSFVKSNCDREDIISAMKAAKQDIENKDQEMPEEQEAGVDEMQEDSINTRAQIQNFIEEVSAAGFPQEVAKRALNHFEPDNVDEAILWCFEHDASMTERSQVNTGPDSDDAMVIEETTSPVEEESIFRGWAETDDSMSSITASILRNISQSDKEVANIQPLLQNLMKLWDEFLSSVSSSVKDYLSIEHMGIILRRLALRETKRVTRKLPPNFNEGEPNLILCPQVDVLNTVMSVYAFDDSQSLPGPDEVLVCTQDTTIDQLDTFWRRAVSIDSPKGKIHCLVNGDLLDYEVSDQGERRLEKHRDFSDGHNFNLIVICSTENEYKSRLVAALDKYRRPPILMMTIQNIRNYVFEKVQVNEETPDDIKPAAFIDFDKSSVRVVKSLRAGVGKTLYKKRMMERLNHLNPNLQTQGREINVPLHEKCVDITKVMTFLLKETLPAGLRVPRLFHIDLSFEVQENVDFFLFNLLILRCLVDRNGYVWWRSPDDIYLIETMPVLWRDTTQKNTLRCTHSILDILPDLMCRSPQESLDIMQNRNKPEGYKPHDRLFDKIEFRSKTVQWPYQYLRILENEGANIDPSKSEGDMEECLLLLLRHCGVRNPSWAEIHHFVRFLTTQLEDFEKSDFCGKAAEQDLPGFKQFVLQFLITMSRDFATRSLVMSEESPVNELVVQHEEAMEDEIDDVVDRYQMRRTWENSPHPYLFFNPDKHSMTFLGFNIDHRTGDLIDTQSREVLQRNVMPKQLFQGLKHNKVPITENFESLSRAEKIAKVCGVLGNDMEHDPDETYELTTDNVKKIMAIYMRFRCGIPVIIMGETGCGKTRLVKFMCELQCPPGVDVKNMILMKVHGGTTNDDIIKKVKEAQGIANKNCEEYGVHFFTVLFFDEANTTESIGLIKEIMCDGSIAGEKFVSSDSLKIVAACNPYKKHSGDLIKRLEKAGLGYHVDADKTTDRLGRVPMRHLVYRVQPLPQSMLPLVWDFGQLNTEVEELYIKQMVSRYIRKGRLPNLVGLVAVVSRILTVSQDFMREQKDECSFVSLRDVERVLSVMSWFYEQKEEERNLFIHMDESTDMDDYTTAALDIEEEDYEEEEMSMMPEAEVALEDDWLVTRSLVLALGVCYHACLKKRREYRERIAGYFQQPCVPVTSDEIYQEINSCQEVFLENVQLGPNIAQNQALKENVFMMVICTELRIPLFLVGKPGSSKSLAKTIVADAMQGNAARGELFRQLKQVQMISFQCSPLSTPDGIVGTFRHCARFQKDKDMDRFVSVVVLDEVGLAEDSPRMPLKTLHPLLEDGCQGDEKPEEYMKVAFIGISNWALDPAKMNRGILVQREVPDRRELIESAEGICAEKAQIRDYIKTMLRPMAESYLDLFDKALDLREFFGLRDFYSLVKMVYAFAEHSNSTPTWHQLKHAILRNFGGLEIVNPVEAFKKNLVIVDKDNAPGPDDPDCSPTGLITAALEADNTSECRYLLLLTENYEALSILQQLVPSLGSAITIFGSSFPSDQEYTQVCRNINRIKVCMETGNTVVLLNLENLYESLYDALNQYYVCFGGDRYVDLGLGTHRVKCRVHQKFRLIVVAEKNVVYKKFPIPLINRLEKHFLTVTTLLDKELLQLKHELEQWAEDFNTPRIPLPGRKKLKMGDSFMGYHADTCAAAILYAFETMRKNKEGGRIQYDITNVLEYAKHILLWCATPDAVFRVATSRLSAHKDEVERIYLHEQHHESLLDYLQHQIGEVKPDVTTHSKLLSDKDIVMVAQELKIMKQRISLLTLQSFGTEQQFCRKIRKFIENNKDSESLLLVQCDSGDLNSSLIACARYCVQDEIQHQMEQIPFPIHVVFVIQVPRIAGECFTGFQCGKWHSAHVDDVQPQNNSLPSIMEMRGLSVGILLETAVQGPRPRHQEVSMDTDGSDVFENDLSGDVEMEDSNQPAPLLTKQFDLAKLVYACIQSAAAKVKDTQVTQRSTERVKILLDLLSHYTCSLLSGLGRHLVSIMKEKELRTQYGEFQDGWLTVEATDSAYINSTGTFRRAWTQCLEEKVSSVLAAVIAFVDTNQNLDLLSHTAPDSWQTAFWLQILNAPDASQIEISELVLSRNGDELTELCIMKSMGYEGQDFTVTLPFSWLIFRKINTILKTVASTNIQQQDEIVTDAARVLQNTPLGQILEQPISGEVRLDILKAYLFDFMHMAFRSHDETEHELVCESLFNALQEKLSNMQTTETEDLITLLITIHMVFDSLKNRLKQFSDVVQVWPGCPRAIKTLQDSGQRDLLISSEEFTLDLLALKMMLAKLQPSNQNQLKDDQGRNSWLKKVQVYRPLVERILGSVSMDSVEVEHGIYGRRCREAVKKHRQQWAGIVIVKLFIEHVCRRSAAEERDSNIAKRCSVLGQLFKENADLKKLDGVKKVEQFLQIINKQAMKEYLGEQEQCPYCETPVDSPPVVLPCQHTICVHCFNDLKNARERKCPKCGNMVPLNFNPEEENNDVKNIQDFKNFRKRCNSFFMAVVAQLCFADNLPPEENVIDKLLGYITMETKDRQIRSKDLTIFSTCLDPTPVFRLFLLQLLFSKSGDRVEENFKRYFDHATKLIQGSEDEEDQLQELSLLIIQCLEDSYHQESSGLNNEQRIQFAVDLLKASKHGLTTNESTVEKLTCLAEARFGLSLAAKFMCEVYVKNSQKIIPEIIRLINAASSLCEESDCRWPKIFFAKQLCRTYGMDSYRKLVQKRSDHRFLQWVVIKDLRDQVEYCSDRYIVCGEEYRQFREAVTHVAIGEDIGELEKTFEENIAEAHEKEILLCLAMHREITMSWVHSVNKQKFAEKVGETFPNICKLIDSACILRNNIGKHCTELNITEGMDLHRQDIACLLLHWLVILIFTPSQNSLMEPLSELVLGPETMVNSLLPTMPQDDLDEVKEVFLAARELPGADENPVFYRCPNGHPYSIGNCGRPAVVGVCAECGKSIGGTSHKLQPQNKKDQGIDMTMNGHLLGRPDERKHVSVPERGLGRAACAVVRILTHMSMYGGANYNPQAVQSMIHPDIEVEDVPQFLWEHIIVDLDILQNILNKNMDEIILMMHIVVDNIQTNGFSDHIQERNILATKKQREMWEKRFDEVCVTPILENLGDALQETGDEILKDNRMGADPLLCLMYEIDVSQQRLSPDMLHEVPAVWRYRSRITLDDLKTKFEIEKGAVHHQILGLFLREDNYLQAVQFVPNILKLQQMLIKKYQRKLDRNEVESITIEEFLRAADKDGLMQEYDMLVGDFMEAWNCCREALQSYPCITTQGPKKVSKEYCQREMTKSSPLGMLIPTLRDSGLCSYALLHFLLTQQNEFLQKYCNKTVPQKRFSDMVAVTVSAITPAHLISYHPDHDILPMILANCNYEFEVGKGTKIEYDYANIEHQLIDRLFFSRSRITIEQIDTLVYRAGSTNAEVFANLDMRIKQEPLTMAVKNQICSEFRSLTDICSCLHQLDIAISFLISVGGSRDDSLEHFMLETLKMEWPIESQKARQRCKFCHVRSLWFLLSMEKSKRLTQHGKNAFEDVDDDFIIPLPSDLKESLDECMRSVSLEKIEVLLQLIFECIILQIAIPQNVDDEDYVDTRSQRLCDTISGYVDILEDDSHAKWWMTFHTQFPQDILGQHAIATWETVFHSFQDKHQGL
ncbi:hypothetical protein ScPMuIL_011802, partial [Solemya velum]